MIDMQRADARSAALTGAAVSLKGAISGDPPLAGLQKGVILDADAGDFDNGGRAAGYLRSRGRFRRAVGRQSGGYYAQFFPGPATPDQRVGKFAERVEIRPNSRQASSGPPSPAARSFWGRSRPAPPIPPFGVLLAPYPIPGERCRSSGTIPSTLGPRIAKWWIDLHLGGVVAKPLIACDHRSRPNRVGPTRLGAGRLGADRSVKVVRAHALTDAPCDMSGGHCNRVGGHASAPSGSGGVHSAARVSRCFSRRRCDSSRVSGLRASSRSVSATSASER